MRRPKIVQGRVAKTINQRALLEQAYIKDSNKTVGEVVKEAIAGIGENIKIRRFERCGAHLTVGKRSFSLVATTWMYCLLSSSTSSNIFWSVGHGPLV